MVSLSSDNIVELAWIVMMIVMYFFGFCTKVPHDEAHQDNLGGITRWTPDLEAEQGGSGGNDHRKREYKYDGDCAVCLEEFRGGETSRVLVTSSMLEASLKHRSAFLHLSMIDPYYNTCPSEEEWNIAEKIARFLEPFFHITTLFSGSYYPTANLYFHSVWRIQVRILKELESEDQVIQAMAKVMKEKFDKYWDCYSVVLSFAIILDPRYKLQFVEFCYERLYGNDAVSRAKILRDKLYVIFKGYLQHSTGNSSTMAQRPSCGTPDCDTRDDLEGFDTITSRLVGPSTRKSQLDIYLEESRLNHREHENLNVLGFWKEQCHRFPELSLMARDILSIPITTVASESAFSIGGRILDAQDEDERLVEDLESLCISQSDAHMDDE
ncbi:hypothetical protein RHMOL_Rhmol06G0278900 [Rhododendron molle]|uniref:Uncharacterized protein n=1 Tax=Rhododendron molle TaxID=49168 RepID=A0ACC0NHC0_RHOML|nr:hypothetical protein RHMOL_Rhmol06G0278900 [Rhododendron molle]